MSHGVEDNNPSVWQRLTQDGWRSYDEATSATLETKFTAKKKSAIFLGFRVEFGNMREYDDFDKEISVRRVARSEVSAESDERPQKRVKVQEETKIEKTLAKTTTPSVPPSSRVLNRLLTPYSVDLAIDARGAVDPKVIVVRFGKEGSDDCIEMDDTLLKIVSKVRKFAEIYLVDKEKVPDFNDMYELEDDVHVMFFYENEHVQVDCGSGRNTSINFPIKESQEMIDLIELVFRGAKKGKKKVDSNKDYSTKGKY